MPSSQNAFQDNVQSAHGKIFLNQGLKRFEARHKVIEVLKSRELYNGCTEHQMNLPVCRYGKSKEAAFRKSKIVRFAAKLRNWQRQAVHQTGALIHRTS